MPQAFLPIPRFPPMLARTFQVLPLAPLSLTLTVYAGAVARQHPSLFRRMGDHQHARFVLDPTDLPFVICLEPKGGKPTVTATRSGGDFDARIAGPLAALLGLVNGAFDGDALFFSRDLIIEGDTAAALALRNAVDDAELDLTGEFERISGPCAQPVRLLMGFIERKTGVCLSRPPEEVSW
ncbi:MAG: SCP2 sterol-binding domain-containing protein [Stappiaceae bacterium]